MSTQRFDDTAYSDVLSDALESFRQDSNYALSMMRQATNIIAKRDVWKLRLELRAAEKKARTLCHARKDFECVLMTPCGTGQCRFAEGDLSLVEGVEYKESAIEKPQGGMACDPDAAVPALQRLRS